MAKRKQTRRNRSSGNVRVRAKALSEVDETKLSLAFWLIAKRLVDDQTDQDEPTNEDANEAAS